MAIDTLASSIPFTVSSQSRGKAHQASWEWWEEKRALTSAFLFIFTTTLLDHIASGAGEASEARNGTGRDLRGLLGRI